MKIPVVLCQYPLIMVFAPQHTVNIKISMKVSDLKKKLHSQSKEDLVKDILDLFKKNQFVKDYYIEKESGDHASPVFIKHKQIINKEFFPDRGDGKARLSVAKNAISEFEKVSSNTFLIAELLVNNRNKFKIAHQNVQDGMR